MRTSHGFILLTAILCLLITLDLALGTVAIPFNEILNYLKEGVTGRDTWTFILSEVRIPRILTAILAGSALAVSGLLMQTLFRNPLAGPYVLGISSGASLGVALWTLFGAGMLSSGSIVFSSNMAISTSSLSSQMLSAALGALLIFGLIILFSRFINDPTVLLLLGFLLGAITGGIVSLLVYFSSTVELESFLMWSFGSFSRVPKERLLTFAIAVLIPLLLCIPVSKNLNAFLVGQQTAESLGIQTRRLRSIMIILSSTLAAVVTVFCGPLGFLGIAVPHLCRSLFKTHDHFVLIPACIISGSVFCLLSDLIANLPGSQISLPLNAVTATLGAPIVMFAIISSRGKTL